MSHVLTMPGQVDVSESNDSLVAALSALDERWIAQAIHVCEHAAQGDFEPRIMNCDTRSATGRLGRAINDLLDRADSFVREAAATLDHASHDKYFRRVLPNGMVGAYRRAAEIINNATDAMAAKSRSLAEHERRRGELAGELESNVGVVVATLTNSAAALRRNARQLAGLAQQTNQAAATGLTAAGEATKHVRHIGTAGDVLANSERTVEQRVQRSHDVAGIAVRDAARTGELMRQLGEANERISDVVTLIANIARQTNLLSLNASIEAARAGDAGRGFAVVAMEVKKLADETAEATKRITKEIAAVQNASRETAQSIAAIEGTIQQINALASEIDDAVHQQIEMTAEMQQRLRETDGHVAQAAVSIEQTGTAAERTNTTAEGLLTSADLVSEQTEALSAAVRSFLLHLRGS